MSFSIRKGVKEDLPKVLDLITELAIYERAPHEVSNTLEMMERDGFGDRPLYEFYVAEKESTIIGISLFYYRYSTWKGKCMYLEDLIVTNEFRGNGVGKKLFDVTIEHAVSNQCNQMLWQVLDWNEPAIRFYKRLNATLDGEWINCKLSRKQLREYDPNDPN